MRRHVPVPNAVCYRTELAHRRLPPLLAVIMSRVTPDVTTLRDLAGQRVNLQEGWRESSECQDSPNLGPRD
jgi:hypothetical protein